MKKLKLVSAISTLSCLLAVVGCSGGSKDDAMVNADVQKVAPGGSLPPGLESATAAPGGTTGGPETASSTP